jgi:putative ABC transport system permease protein
MLADIRFALRQLLKNRMYTAVAVATLALGIGVNTMMFSVLDALVLQVSRARDPGRLVAVFRTSAQAQDWAQSPGNYFDFAREQKSFEEVGAFYGTNYNLAEPGLPAQRLAGMAISGSVFKVFGIAPELGQTFGPEYDHAGVGEVAVLSDAFWRSHFAADPSVIGRTVRMDATPVTIIGVMPPSFENPLYWGYVDLWRPMGLDAASSQIRNNFWIQTVGRLKPGVSIQAAQAEATAIAERLAHDFPETNGNGLRLESWNRVITGDFSRNLSWLCMMLAGFVLLIACANLANLQLARITSRAREHAVRIALGASRLKLIRQLLVESLFLSILGGGVGVVIAVWGARLISNGIYIGGVRGIAIPINVEVLLFTLIASAAAGIAAGTFPAWIASRTDVNSALKQGSRGSTGDRSRHLLRKVLIVSELSLALILLTGAEFFVRGMQRMTHSDMGWQPDGLITANMSLPFNAKYQSDAQCQEFFRRLQVKLDELPGMKQATISTYLPITGFWRTSSIQIQGRPPSAKGKEPLSSFNSVTPGNFDTMGIRLVQGRDFTDADRADSRRVAIINESMAKSLFPGENPIGKRIAAAGPNPDWEEIVGVSADVHAAVEVIRRPDTPFLITIPLAQTPESYIHWFNVAVRSSAPVPDIAAALRSAVQQLDPDQPVYAILSAREAMDHQVTAGLTLVGKLLGAFALVGLMLSAVGIYGVISYLAAQRTSEIGIRMALGAQQRDVLWLILGQGVRLSVLGAVIGLACSWGLIRLMTSMLPSFPGSDPVSIGGVAVLLAAVAVVASWLPARRATKVDPIIALRAE